MLKKNVASKIQMIFFFRSRSHRPTFVFTSALDHAQLRNRENPRFPQASVRSPR